MSGVMSSLLLMTNRPRTAAAALNDAPGTHVQERQLPTALVLGATRTGWSSGERQSSLRIKDPFVSRGSLRERLEWAAASPLCVRLAPGRIDIGMGERVHHSKLWRADIN